jgi:hypothetical protein
MLNQKRVECVMKTAEGCHSLDFRRDLQEFPFSFSRPPVTVSSGTVGNLLVIEFFSITIPTFGWTVRGKPRKAGLASKSRRGCPECQTEVWIQDAAFSGCHWASVPCEWAAQVEHPSGLKFISRRMQTVACSRSQLPPYKCSPVAFPSQEMCAVKWHF